VPLNRITEAILVTKGRKYLPSGPHVGQPCAAEWCFAQNLLTIVSKEACATAQIQGRHLPITFISNIARDVIFITSQQYAGTHCVFVPKLQASCELRCS